MGASNAGSGMSLATSNGGSGMQQIVSTDGRFLSTSKRLDCIHVSTWVWPCRHNIRLRTPSVLYFAPVDDPVSYVDKITNAKWMISGPLVCLLHPLCHSLLQVFQCSRMCVLKPEPMLSYPVPLPKVLHTQVGR